MQSASSTAAHDLSLTSRDTRLLLGPTSIQSLQFSTTCISVNACSFSASGPYISASELRLYTKRGILPRLPGRLPGSISSSRPVHARLTYSLTVASISELRYITLASGRIDAPTIPMIVHANSSVSTV